MKIAGYIKNSFVDYPAHISCAVFLGGCNFDCWYCHNRPYIRSAGDIDADEALEFLKSRKGWIQGVVITGGEPTLNKELPEFIKKVKDLGYPVKLDTNGSRPDVLKSLIDQGLIDYVAMDYKAPLEKYALVAGVPVDILAIKKSVEIIMNSGIDYEFRTTFAPTLTKEDIVKIVQEIKGAKRYSLQQYRHDEMYCEILGQQIRPHSKEYFLETLEEVKKIFPGEVNAKGL
ncbi:MAG TPA: anaerobic ribonucleoside-triphosphate reductase activating protein [Clostridia bacterium]